MTAVDEALLGWGIAWRWTLLYSGLTFVTQLWAGSQYSPGQGGGWGELVMWSAAFGVLVIAVALERAIRGRRHIEAGAVFIAATVGQVVGAIAAVVWFLSKGGPSPGDWWIGPAGAALFATVWVHLAGSANPPG